MVATILVLQCFAQFGDGRRFNVELIDADEFLQAVDIAALNERKAFELGELL